MKRVFLCCCFLFKSNVNCTNDNHIDWHTHLCAYMCTVLCGVLCCEFNATGNWLGSDPGASGHCESFTLPRCSQHTAHLRTLCHASVWKLHVISNVCLSDMSKGVSRISTGCLQAARKEEWRRWSRGRQKTSLFVLPQSRCSPEMAAPSLFAIFIKGMHTPPWQHTTLPLHNRQCLMHVFRQRAVRLFFRNTPANQNQLAPL